MAVIAETSAHTAVPALLEAGADVNAEDAKGLTPLHWAALTKGPEVITTLIEAGADPDARTKNGMTPLDVAIRQKATENADALRGAKKTSGTGRP